MHLGNRCTFKQENIYDKIGAPEGARAEKSTPRRLQLVIKALHLDEQPEKISAGGLLHGSQQSRWGNTAYSSTPVLDCGNTVSFQRLELDELPCRFPVLQNKCKRGWWRLPFCAVHVLDRQASLAPHRARRSTATLCTNRSMSNKKN